MKTCACCDTESTDKATTCPRCGEASWLPSARPTPTKTEAIPAPIVGQTTRRALPVVTKKK